MAQADVQYINRNLKKLANYINYLVDFSKKYDNAIKELCSKSGSDKINKTENFIKNEKELKESYYKALELYNDLKMIANRCSNHIDVTDELIGFHQKFKAARLRTYKKATITLTQPKEKGVPTGGASMPTNPQKADFSGFAKKNLLIWANMKINKYNPDAQELANLFIVGTQKAPNSEEYRQLPPGSGEIVNAKYNLKKTNKEIKKSWPGFAYSKYSTLSKNVSKYADLRNQLEKHYNKTTGKFDSNKIDVNFDKDENLHLSLGHATILDPTIDEQGYFQGILFDKYDFDPVYKNMYKNPKITIANDYFWAAQIKPGRNFYVLAPIKFKW